MNQIKTEEEKILKILTETQWPTGQNQVQCMFNESPQKRKFTEAENVHEIIAKFFQI